MSVQCTLSLYCVLQTSTYLIPSPLWVLVSSTLAATSSILNRQLLLAGGELTISGCKALAHKNLSISAMVNPN